MNYVTEEELATALDLSVSTLRKWRRDETGPPWKRHGLKRVSYEVDSVLAWCQANDVVIFNPFDRKVSEDAQDAAACESDQ